MSATKGMKAEGRLGQTGSTKKDRNLEKRVTDGGGGVGAGHHKGKNIFEDKQARMTKPQFDRAKNSGNKAQQPSDHENPIPYIEMENAREPEPTSEPPHLPYGLSS